jgi:hypothetical protein
MDFEESQAAPAAVAVRTRNSRRRMRPPEDLWRFFRLHQSLGAGKVQGRNPHPCRGL